MNVMKSKGANLLAAAVVAFSALSSPAYADEAAARTSLLKSTESTQAVYFGNGCFWGRQKDFVTTEQEKLGRGNEISAVVGYAAGQRAGPNDRVCYYYNDPRTQYEKLGHAEVVQVAVSTEPQQAEKEFKAFAETYFKQFKRTPYGMIRSDPQDVGAGYRNVVGIPGGISSPLFKLLQEANVNGMELREGNGNDYVDGKPLEDDLFNVVWVVDSSRLPFYRAERYHQFHHGLGKKFSESYVRDLKRTAEKQGVIDPTGCLELPM